jgi:hypothetical protein
LIGGVIGRDVALSATGDQADYINRCEAKGVPIPPVWGDPAWEFVGVHPAALVQVSKGFVAEVWKYTDDPQGICMALPRKDPTTGVIQLLGIICQGKGKLEGTKPRERAYACFWDNVDPETEETRITGTQEQLTASKQIDPALIKGGNRLKENCTNCHRGDNAFLIIPDSADSRSMLDIGGTDADRGPYIPIGKSNWKNTPLSSNLKKALSPPGQGCQRCHSIAGVVPNSDGIAGYCDRLKDTLTVPNENGKLLMPPDRAAPNAAEKADIAALREACKKYGVELPSF